jgi:hypothetical protein
MNKDLDYENNNIAYDLQYTEADGGGIKCKNYIICESVLPKWWFDCKGCYLCINCLICGYKILEVSNNLECPICLEVKECVTQPKCCHTLCINCFKRCYHGDKNIDGEPTFPYPNIEDEYFDDTENTKWINDYPLIKIYNEEWNKWDDCRQEKYEQEEYLRKCPICRM